MRRVGDFVAFVKGLHCRRLIQQGRFRDAETAVARAIAEHPRHPGLRRRSAVIAQRDGRFGDAIERWRDLLLLAPARPAAWAGLASCLRAAQQLDDAKAAIERALALEPDEPNFQAEAARIFDARGEPKRSVPLWSQVVSRTEAPAESWQAFIEAQLRLGHLDDAEKALATAYRRYPGHRNLDAASGVLAIHRDDWERAFEIWSHYAARYPDDWIGGFYRDRAAMMLQFQQAERPPSSPSSAPVAVVQVDDEGVRKLLSQFESLGEDCEFGTVQRRYGAEPLGLLRWNDVTYRSLAAALEDGFRDCGAPEMTVLDVGEIDEIYVRDRRWDLGMHTFLFSREVCMDALLPKMCRRLVFLRDKLLDDLATGTKTFVFKSDRINFRELKRLHELLNAYGAVRLLHVRQARWAGVQGWPDAAPAGVATVSAGLFVGYLSRMGDLEDIRFDEWIGLCRASAHHPNAAST